jgi:hypothetical protein
LIKYNQLLTSSIFGLILLVLTTCNTDQLIFDDIKIPNYQGDVTIVIGQTNYTISELLEDLNDPNIDITEDAAGLISVSYRDTTIFDDVTEFLDLDDIEIPSGSQAIGIDFSTPANTPIDIPIPTIDLPLVFTSPNGEELDDILYSAGTLTLVIDAEFSAKADFVFEITSFIHSETNDTLRFKGSFLNDGNPVTISIDLTGYRTTIVSTGASNEMIGKFDATLKLEGGESGTSDQRINYDLTMNGALFSVIHGWFGNLDIEIQSQTIEIDFFEGILEEALVFGDPRVNFYLENSFGVPLGMVLNDISSSNADGTEKNLSGPITESPQNIRAPLVSEAGGSLPTTISINNENSNIQELLSISPNLFTLTVSAVGNYLNPDTDLPTEDQDTTQNFVTDSSFVDIITEISLPLEVQLSGFTRDFDPIDIESFDFEDADTLAFILKSINDLPFNGAIDMQFMNADSVVIFEFPNVLLLASPELDGTGRSIEPATNTAKIKVYKGNGYQEMLDAALMKLVMHIDSFEADQDNFVKIYADYETTLKVSLQGNLNIEL